MFVHPTVQHNVNEIVRKRSRERESLRLRSSVRFTKGRQTLDQETMTSPESSKKEKLIPLSIGAFIPDLITSESWIRRKLNFRFQIDSYTSNYFFHPRLVRPSARHSTRGLSSELDGRKP